MFILDLGSRIQKQQQKRGVKKIWASFQRIIELFTHKFATNLSKIWVWDSGSEIRDLEKNLFRIQDPGPGVKKATYPGSHIRICNTVKDQ
jgi:hypothetical protein